MAQGESKSGPARSGLIARLFPRLRTRQQTRLLPLARLAGGPRVATEASIRALATATPLAGNLLLCRVLGRYKFLVEATDLTLAPHLMLDGYWEWWTTSFLARNLRRGESVADAGAGIGYFSLLAADLVGPQGRVLAIEPNPASAELVRRNVRLNGFADRVAVEEAALAPAENRLVRLAVPPDSPMDAQLLPQSLGRAAPVRPETRPVEMVRGRTLDELLPQGADVIRLDVGDALEAAWDGAQGVLAAQPGLRMLVVFDPSRCLDPAALLRRIAARFPLRRLHPDGKARGCDQAELLAGGQALLYLARDEPA
ncbi:FkbM family methyltransferase [Roseicella aquatilis]|nr:FkbM family methyltransferase [Roseicella aquatilis]